MCPSYRGITVAFMVLVALALATSVAGGAANPPRPLPPEQAKAKMDAPGPPPTVSVRAATRGELIAASKRPGADTEGVIPSSTSRFAALEYCWYATASKGWGDWPYDRYVHQHTWWCGYWAGALTARTTYTTADSTLCASHDIYNFKVSGGLGYSSVYVESGAYFDCYTPVPWVTLHSRNWLRVYYNSQGGAWILDWGGIG
jgi:hypothetical protein